MFSSKSHKMTAYRQNDGSRTLVRPDNSSNQQKVELMSGRTQVLQLFWQFLKALMETVDPLSDRILIGKNYHKSISKTFCTILKTWPLLEFFLSFKLTTCVI